MAIGACTLLVVGPLALSSEAVAAPPPPPARAAAAFVDLGTAASYSVLAGSGVSNTGAATVLALDLGLSPSGVIAGFPPGTARAIHDKDTAAATAQEDRQAAYDAVVAQTGGTAFGGDQAGAIFKPGLHTSAAALTNTGTITLDADGDPGAVFVFQVQAALSSAAASKVVLTDGALAHNVFWQVTGAVSLGAGVKWVGTLLGAGAVAFGEGASLKGRIMTPTTVALANSPITKPIDDLTAPLVTLDGGDSRFTNDTTPAITGTTDEPAGRPVQVTVDGQSLNTTVSAGGAWSVGAAFLAEGSYEVIASVTDPSQNTGTATQVLTVDVTDGDVTIDGGGTRATNDTTPTISGTTNEPGAPTVSVTIDEQPPLTTTAGSGGVWSVEAPVLTEASHAVVAEVEDLATNTSSASQILIVDLTLPVVTINGGATRSTVDRSPWTYGETAEQAGTLVHVTVDGQNLTATVQPGGTWGVSAEAMTMGTHTVVASVTDAAQNTGTATQTLTITGIGDPGDPVDPDPEPRYKPDAAIRVLKGNFVGANSYGSQQKVTKQLSRRIKSTTFEVRVTNRGDATDRMEIVGTPRNVKFKVTYFAGGRDVTKAVLAGTYRTGSLMPGESASLMVKVTKTKRARSGNHRTFVVRASSSHAQATRDAVAAVVRMVGA